jgi:hypothetical protein
MLPLLLASCAVMPDAGGCNPSVCSCQALTAGDSMRNSMRSVRKAANSLDLGMLDTMLLDGSQTALGEAVESVRSLHDTCSVGRCGNGTALLPRRSCRCRLARLLNLSTSTQHKLDDSAAGVLCVRRQSYSAPLQRHPLSLRAALDIANDPRSMCHRAGSAIVSRISWASQRRYHSCCTGWHALPPSWNAMAGIA